MFHLIKATKLSSAEAKRFKVFKESLLPQKLCKHEVKEMRESEASHTVDKCLNQIHQVLDIFHSTSVSKHNFTMYSLSGSFSSS